MKKNVLRVITLLIFTCLAVTPATAADTLIPVGKVVGLELQNGSVTVAAFDTVSPARDAGIRAGDRLIQIDGVSVTCAEDVHRALARSDGSVVLTVSRSGDTHALRIEPAITADGPRLGLFLKQGVTGIGTVTYYDPNSGTFATLGHGVNDGSGSLLTLRSGSAYPAKVISVRKGKSGEPGQLIGTLTQKDPLGTLYRNCQQGVFGKTEQAISGKALRVGCSKSIHPGNATILSTVNGESPREYSVEILKIYPAARQNGRNLLLRVTDPALLETTGGIVQGMSGSPIIQDGKLVGAVTHVLVNDPTTGYGIFIENMLDAAA